MFDNIYLILVYKCMNEVTSVPLKSGRVIN